MSFARQSDFRNRLLTFMSADDFRLLQPNLESVVYASGDVLATPNQPSNHLHFLESGLASQIGAAADRQRIETGIYGRDGVGPSSILLGVDRSPYHHLIQMKGEGHRIRVDRFTEALGFSLSLQVLFLRYAQCMTIQTGYTAISNGHNHLVERLARWLLMCHDRVDGNEIRITHEYLGVMLGVRRAGVSQAIKSLEERNAIRTKRGRIEILGRRLLQDAAAGSYGVPEAEYARLIGPLH